MLLTLIKSMEGGSMITFKFEVDQRTSKEYAKQPLDFAFNFHFFNKLPQSGTQRR